MPGPEPEPRPDRTGRTATGDDETGRARAAGRDGFRAEPGLLLVEAEMADGMLDADEASWRGAVLGVEARAAQALQALRAGELDGVTLDLCDGRQWQLTLGRLRRFWRRPQPLAERARDRGAGVGMLGPGALETGSSGPLRTDVAKPGFDY
ncbi:MAG: hypothetical protein ACOC26_02245 [Halochromatium sp.]